VSGASGSAAVTVNLRRVIVWLTFALVVLFVIQFPDRAADMVRTAGGGLVHVGSSLVDFVGSLV
jgi:hypothetical protein